MNKWFLMLGYAIIVATSQMLWLTFSPITTIAASIMNTSVSNIGILSLVFPFVYVILALPLSRWLDKRFIPAIITGVLLTGVGGVLRLISPFNFTFQLGCQVLISLGQPLLLGALAIVPVYYFSESERPIAISLGSLSLFIGIIVATGGGAFIYYHIGYHSMLLLEAIPGLLGIAIMIAALRGSKVPEFVKKESVKFRLTGLHWKLAIMLFVGMGVYDALDTWLQPMLSGYGLSGDAGNIIALMTLTGIFGAAVLPQIVSRKNYRKLSIFAIVGVSILSLLILGLINNLYLIAGSFAIDGFFLLAGLPILIEWAESATPAANQGQVTGFIMLFGNLGGLILIFLDDFLLSYGNIAIIVLMSLFMVALVPVLIKTQSVVIRPKPIETK
jgi:MFS family permease